MGLNAPENEPLIQLASKYFLGLTLSNVIMKTEYQTTNYTKSFSADLGWIDKKWRELTWHFTLHVLIYNQPRYYAFFDFVTQGGTYKFLGNFKNIWQLENYKLVKENWKQFA